MDSENRGRLQRESRIEPRIESRLESRIEPRIESRIEPGIEPRLESRIEPRIEPRIESRIEPRLAKLINNYSADFREKIDQERNSLPPASPLQLKTGEDESSDMVVCVRQRPRLSHEVASEYFSSVLVSNPTIRVLAPSYNVKGLPTIKSSNFSVDLAFGPEVENAAIYRTVCQPLVDLALQGGICSVLAYGQTGSGKTFTISGMLERICEDLFLRQGNVSGDVKLYVSYFELLGNHLTDLLQPDTSSRVEVMEDKFGKVNVVGAVEREVGSGEELWKLAEQAALHRTTAPTFKNDTSSRTHAVCKIRVENTVYKSAEDGCLFVIDLAGAENASDSQFHNKERISETKHINTSLMALKNCIINRAKSSRDLSRHYHIPFRQSKLTLLLKDAFELESHKVCRTVIFANIAPTVADLTMTLNTLRYVTPIKEGMMNKVKVVPDPRNPGNWDNPTLVNWVVRTSRGKVDPKVLCPWESGRQLLRIPETEFIERVIRGNSQISEKGAKDFYGKLWKCLVDARTKERKAKRKVQQPSVDFDAEIVAVTEDQGHKETGNRLQHFLDDNILSKGVSFAVLGSVTGSLLALPSTRNPAEWNHSPEDWTRDIQAALKSVGLAAGAGTEKEKNGANSAEDKATEYNNTETSGTEDITTGTGGTEDITTGTGGLEVKSMSAGLQNTLVCHNFRFEKCEGVEGRRWAGRAEEGIVRLDVVGAFILISILKTCTNCSQSHLRKVVESSLYHLQ